MLATPVEKLGEGGWLLITDTKFVFEPFQFSPPGKQYHLTYTFIRVNSKASIITKPSLEMKTLVISDKYQLSRWHFSDFQKLFLKDYKLIGAGYSVHLFLRMEEDF